ncbi:MAG: carboxypeptidase regulatory-like domain-containing protein [Actinobacteria bacterium]|nr:carboxypeptidase regulatory-like domain-containing protein [Actinomycetota bacterium]
MRHDGEPFAEKEVVLVPLLPGEKIEIFSPSKGGTREVSLSVWDIDILEGEKIIFATDRNGRAMEVKTNSEGSFVIKNVDPGKYILLQMVAGSVIIMGTKDGFIRVVAEEGKTNDIGTITLLHPSESIIEWEKKRSQE